MLKLNCQNSTPHRVAKGYVSVKGLGSNLSPCMVSAEFAYEGGRQCTYLDRNTAAAAVAHKVAKLNRFGRGHSAVCRTEDGHLQVT